MALTSSWRFCGRCSSTDPVLCQVITYQSLYAVDHAANQLTYLPTTDHDPKIYSTATFNSQKWGKPTFSHNSDTGTDISKFSLVRAWEIIISAVPGCHISITRVSRCMVTCICRTDQHCEMSTMWNIPEATMSCNDKQKHSVYVKLYYL